MSAGSIEVVPATVDRWADVVTLLGGNGDLGCWCQAPRGRAVGYGRSRPGVRRSSTALESTASNVTSVSSAGSQTTSNSSTNPFFPFT